MNPNCIILDYCSTVSSVMNPYILSDIKDCHHNTYIHVFTNGGYIGYKQSSKMDLFTLRVFYNPYSIVNIFSLVDVTSQFRVTMDTNNEPAILVQTIPYSMLKFYQCHKGLYYFDTSDPYLCNPSVNAYSLLTTIQDNTMFFIYPKLK